MSKETALQRGAQGRGIGFQINCIVVISIVIVMGIVLGIVGKMTFDALEDEEKTERFNELGKIAASVQTRYAKAYQASALAEVKIQQILQAPPEARSREAVVQVLRDTMAASPELLGAGACFAPNAFDGRDAEMANTEYSDASGRLIPYAMADKVIPLSGYETAGWYTNVEKSHKTMLTDPYTFTSSDGRKMFGERGRLCQRRLRCSAAHRGGESAFRSTALW